MQSSTHSMCHSFIVVLCSIQDTLLLPSVLFEGSLKLIFQVSRHAKDVAEFGVFVYGRVCINSLM